MEEENGGEEDSGGEEKLREGRKDERRRWDVGILQNHPLFYG